MTSEQGQPRLGKDPLEGLAMAAYLAGRDEESEEAWVRIHHERQGEDDAPGAARAAFWLAFQLFRRGEAARAGGWIARAQRILEDHVGECAEKGYLLVPAGIREVKKGNPEGALSLFGEAVRIAERCRNPDLGALARNGQARALLRQGALQEGTRLLDEAMTAVEAGEVSPVVAGDVYCSTIEACHELYDVRRAREWTEALTRWCEAHPDVVPYRGECLIHRAEILQLDGAWGTALEEARRASEELTRPPGAPAAGAAHYQVGELHRLRGEANEAEEAYRAAARRGHPLHPGLALLRADQGRLQEAGAALRAALETVSSRPHRARIIPALVEVALARGAVEEARDAADELTAMASTLSAPFLAAVANRAHGAVLLAEFDPRTALGSLETARRAWVELEAPYEVARTDVLLARARGELGDAEGASLALDGARRAFRHLGATSDLRRLEALEQRLGPTDLTSAHHLTRREAEVLGLLAAGLSNKAIGRRLSISRRTVERHVGNVLRKLGVASRSAAVALAYEEGLVAPGRAQAAPDRSPPARRHDS